MKRLAGLVAAIATPLDGRGGIDHDKLVTHCARLLRVGCDGINLLGTTGEATSFSVEQRLGAMGAVAAAGLPLERFMVGTGAAALVDATRLTARAMELGFAGALVLPPFYYKGIDDDSLAAYFDVLIAAVSSDTARIYLYNFPQNSGVAFPIAVVERLRAAHGDVILGLKDSSGDLPYAAEVARRLPGLDVFPSAEGSVARAVEHGFAGCISATLNVTSSIVAPVWTARAQPGALEIPLRQANAIRAALAGAPLVAAVKWAIGHLLDDPTWNRLAPPLRALNAAERGRLAEALQALDFDRMRELYR